jgi:pimeloyl-ACP methyl ester carboxylesterase
VVTYDPRGADRSEKSNPASPSTPEEHADDLHRLIQALDAGPVDLFASSGGAVNALALVERHPEQVRILVAHEPPLLQLLPDRDAALAAARDVNVTYMRSGFGAGMAKFIALAGRTGPVPADWVDRPAPDPALFGLPTTDDGSRTDVLMAQNMTSGTHYAPDFDALRRASTRVVIAAGTESEGELANRGAHAAAERLGTPPVVFPSHHGGFLGGEYNPTATPRPSPPGCARSSAPGRRNSARERRRRLTVTTFFSVGGPLGPLRCLLAPGTHNHGNVAFGMIATNPTWALVRSAS